MENKNNSNGGDIFSSLLLVAFIVLKLTGVIDWSWWWVLSPLWIPLCLLIVGFAIWFIIMTIKGHHISFGN